MVLSEVKTLEHVHIDIITNSNQTRNAWTMKISEVRTLEHVYIEIITNSKLFKEFMDEAGTWELNICKSHRIRLVY